MRRFSSMIAAAGVLAALALAGCAAPTPGPLPGEVAFLEAVHAARGLPRP
jgi:hypothetical protein